MTAATIPAFRFDKAAHIYYENEVAYASVTQIIHACGIGPDFSFVDVDVLERKRKLGELVHLACHYYDEGRLQHPEQLHPEVFARLAGYMLFRAETGYLPEKHEQPRVATVQRMRFGMTFDSIGLVRRQPWIVDIKNAATETPSWGVQLSAYAMALPKPLPFLTYTRVVVQLFPTGKYKLHTFDDPADYDAWKACYLMAVQPSWATEEQIRQAAQAVLDWKQNHNIHRKEPPLCQQPPQQSKKQ